MLNAKLKMLRVLNEEIYRLEKARKKKYDADLTWCKQMRDLLIGEGSDEIHELLKKVFPSDSSEEKQAMAYA